MEGKLISAKFKPPSPPRDFRAKKHTANEGGLAKALAFQGGKDLGMELGAGTGSDREAQREVSAGSEVEENDTAPVYIPTQAQLPSQRHAGLSHGHIAVLTKILDSFASRDRKQNRHEILSALLACHVPARLPNCLQIALLVLVFSPLFTASLTHITCY